MYDREVVEVVGEGGKMGSISVGGVVWDMVWVVVASDWGMGGKELGNRGEWG